MYSATGSRITVAIGVLALSLVAINQTSTWAAEPVAKEKAAKKSAQMRTSAPASKTTAQKSATEETTEKPWVASVKRRNSTKFPLTKEKPETKSPSLGVALVQRPAYAASPSVRASQLSFTRPTTASPRPCQAAEKGLVLLSVTTASGENSKPFLVK